MATEPQDDTHPDDDTVKKAMDMLALRIAKHALKGGAGNAEAALDSQMLMSLSLWRLDEAGIAVVPAEGEE